MKTNQIILILILGIVLLSKPRKKASEPPPTYNPQTVPPMPPHKSPAWLLWVQGIIGVYGAVSWLWAPGGPFYKIPTKDIYDAVNPNVLNQYQWDDPNSLPPGEYA
jgi:hypothetical protein